MIFVESRDLLRLEPVATPTSTTQPSVKMAKRRRRTLVDGRTAPPAADGHSVGKFGPQVQIVRVTGVVTDPAEIVAGLNTHPAPPGLLVNGGKPVHVKLTDELKVPAPTGAAENV
jgi:hypothetical protein